MQLRLFYELVIGDGESGPAMQESARCEQLKKIVSEALPDHPEPDAPAPGRVTAGSRSAFVVGNNNTVVINLVLPPAEEGGAP